MKKSIAKDSIILAIVKIITICTSLIQTMFLSRIMTLSDYGIYSQLLIVISIATTFTNLGLDNAINYFYNKNEDNKCNYVSSIFALTLITGTIGALLILAFRNQIALYYENKVIIGLSIYIILRPLFANIISLYQALYISAGRTKVIAIRNLIISLLQTLCVPLSFYLFKEIRIMLIVQLSLDILQILYFGFDFSKKEIKINPIKLNKNFIKEILKYAIPIGLALMMGTLFKESDKLVIARLMGKEQLAIYTNMSKQLPFEFIVLAFTAIVTPAIIKCWYKGDIKSIKKIWSNYLQFGYISTWILCSGAIVCARELLMFLYSEKYIEGLSIFIIYLCVELFRFCYFGMILSATGKTKYIMYSSIISLISNLALNVIFYKIIGFIGPALASLISVISMNSLQLLLSCKTLNLKIKDIINKKVIFKTIRCILTTSIITFVLKEILKSLINNYILILIFVYLISIIINFIVLKKDIIFSLKNMKEEENQNEN